MMFWKGSPTPAKDAGMAVTVSVQYRPNDGFENVPPFKIF